MVGKGCRVRHGRVGSALGYWPVVLGCGFGGIVGIFTGWRRRRRRRWRRVVVECLSGGGGGGGGGRGHLVVEFVGTLEKMDI